MQEEMDEMLKLITASDAKINLEYTIPYIESKVNSFLDQHGGNQSVLVLADLLTKENYDQDWVIAQCHSILSYIKLFSEKHFNDAVYGHKLVQITQEFIFEFKAFNGFLLDVQLLPIYDPEKDPLLGQIHNKNYVHSEQAFVTAKMQSFYAGLSSYGTEEYKNKVVPFMIRHALELKIKSEMLGISYAVTQRTDGTYKPKQILISDCIDCLGNEAADLFELPSSIQINDLKIINKWSNNFIHTGLNEYSWQVKTAIDVIEPLFSIKEKGAVNFEGFKFRSATFDMDNLKTALQTKFGERTLFALYTSE